MEKKTKTKKSGAKLRVTYLKSAIGFDKNQKAIIEGLGFKKLGTTKVFPDNACIRGSLFKVKHLVRTEEIKE